MVGSSRRSRPDRSTADLGLWGAGDPDQRHRARRSERRDVRGNRSDHRRAVFRPAHVCARVHQWVRLLPAARAGLPAGRVEGARPLPDSRSRVSVVSGSHRTPSRLGAARRRPSRETHSRAGLTGPEVFMDRATTERWLERFAQQRPKSRALYAEMQQLVAGGVGHDLRHSPISPTYIARASGARKWDIDGNEYLDFGMGNAALLLGHAHPAVLEAVREAIGTGLHFGNDHPRMLDLAQRIHRLMPSPG